VIDITGLPSHGFYALRSIVDPEDQLLEANEANNDVLVYIEIDENQARIIDRVEIPIEPSSQNPPRE
jgi:subtilase family serine protease